MSSYSVRCKQGIDGIIQEEAELLIRSFLDESARSKGTISMSGQNLNVAVVNVLWQMVASKRFDRGVSCIMMSNCWHRVVWLKPVNGLEAKISILYIARCIDTHIVYPLNRPWGSGMNKIIKAQM